jgi:ATP-dependent DNA helicase PIF1
MQLPPVGKSNVLFAFESKEWSRCVQTTFQLKHVFRQKDQSFIKILNEMRQGQLSAESIQKLNALSRPLIFNDGIEPTQL